MCIWFSLLSLFAYVQFFKIPLFLCTKIRFIHVQDISKSTNKTIQTHKWDCPKYMQSGLWYWLIDLIHCAGMYKVLLPPLAKDYMKVLIGYPTKFLTKLHDMISSPMPLTTTKTWKIIPIKFEPSLISTKKRRVFVKTQPNWSISGEFS